MKATIEKVDRLFNELNELRPLSAEAKGKLRQKLNIDWNYNSNAIEGSTLTLGETRTFLLHGITAKGKPFRDYIDAEGHDHAIEAVEAVLKGDHPLTQAFTRELHKILIKEPYTIPAVALDGSETKKTVTPGEYKTLPNHVKTSTGKTHYYASPEETPAKMNDLFDWYNKQTDTHPLITAAAFHYQFVIIHPFDDGNGRMARLLMNLILMKNGYTPAIIPMERRKEYITLLEQMDEANDIEPFAEFVGECLIESLTLAIKAAKGEELLTPDDFDKRVEILKHRASIIEEERDLLVEYASTELVEFDIFLQEKLNKLGELFLNTEIATVFNGTYLNTNTLKAAVASYTWKIPHKINYKREHKFTTMLGTGAHDLDVVIRFNASSGNGRCDISFYSNKLHFSNNNAYDSVSIKNLPASDELSKLFNGYFQAILDKVTKIMSERVEHN